MYYESFTDVLKALIDLPFGSLEQVILTGNLFNYFPVWLRNRLLSAGLELVLSQTD